MDLLKDWKTSQLSLLGALSSELIVQRENLIYHLGDEWKRLVIWKLPPSKGEVSREIDFFVIFVIKTLDGLFFAIFSKYAYLCGCNYNLLSSDSADQKSFLKANLVLNDASRKDDESKPSALLCSVLQALAIQGDLQHKIKLFSNVGQN